MTSRFFNLFNDTQTKPPALPESPSVHSMLSTLSALPQETVRTEVLPPLLGAANLHDMAVTVPAADGKDQYIVRLSRWQRSPAGAVVHLFGLNPEGELCVVLGKQRGERRPPQGFMEAPISGQDYTGLQKGGFTRFHAKTGEGVPADKSFAGNAAREAWEEAGIKLEENQFIYLEPMIDRPGKLFVAVVPFFHVMANTPTLSVEDDEFASDDLQAPEWIPLKNIDFSDPACPKYDDMKIDPKAIPQLNQALHKLGIRGNGLQEKIANLPTDCRSLKNKFDELVQNQEQECGRAAYEQPVAPSAITATQEAPAPAPAIQAPAAHATPSATASRQPALLNSLSIGEKVIGGVLACTAIASVGILLALSLLSMPWLALPLILISASLPIIYSGYKAAEYAHEKFFSNATPATQR